MKALATLFLSCFLAASLAQTFTATDLSFSAGPFIAGAAGPPTITCNTWQDFEFAGSVTAASLALHDHNAIASPWTVNDAGSALSISASGEKATIGSPQGTADAGTTGLAWNCTAGGFAYVYATNAPTDSISAGLWFYATMFATTTKNEGIIEFADGGGSAGLKVIWIRGSGDPLIRLVAGGNHDITGVRTNEWNWVTTKYAKSGTCSLSVYNQSGTLVGTTTGTDATAVQILRTYIGGYATGQRDAEAITLYFDDLCIDNNAAFPVGP